jgi:hypothetical protein
MFCRVVSGGALSTLDFLSEAGVTGRLIKLEVSYQEATPFSLTASAFQYATSLQALCVEFLAAGVGVILFSILNLPVCA